MNGATYPLRNLGRHPRRSVLTAIGVFAAFFVVVVLVSFLTELDRIAERASPRRLITTHKVMAGYPMPERYGGDIAQVSGVEAVTPLIWFGGIYRDEESTDFGQFAADADELLRVYSTIDLGEAEKEAFLADPAGALVGESRARKFGWQVGDRLPIRGTFLPLDLDLTVRGVFHGDPYDESSIYFHRRYIQERMEQPLGAGMYWVLVETPQVAAEVASAIDERFQNTAAPTRTETERAFSMNFFSMLGDLGLLVRTVGGAVLAAILLATASTLALTVRERSRELAVLRTLGFRRSTVVAMMAAEGGLLTGIAGLLGGIAARGATALVDVAALTQVFQSLHVTAGTLVLATGGAILLGAVGAGLPAFLSLRGGIVAGLRRVD